MRVRSRSLACHGWGASPCSPCMLPAMCAGPWRWTELSPPSASSATATTYSCSAVRGAVGVCVAARRRVRVSWPRRHRSHGDGRDRERQCPAVRWPVLPGEVPAGRCPGHYPAVCAVRLGPVRVAASSLLHHCGRVARGPLQQRLWALPRWKGGRARLQEALRAQALQLRVIRVLLAVPPGPPREEEELVQVPRALSPGQVVECQPLFHQTSRMCGPDAALQSQAGQVV